jgi:hypothetical protein
MQDEYVFVPVTNTVGEMFGVFVIRRTSRIKGDAHIYKIPPNLPLPKGGNIPLFGKEGIGEIFWSMWFYL